MRVLLVDPPFHAFMQYDRWYYSTALAQLAAVLHDVGHEVAIYDADKYFHKDPSTKKRSELMKRQHWYHDQVENMEHLIWCHFRETLVDFRPDIVGVSVYTSKLKSALNVLKICKESNPAIRTCVGGAHVTAVPETFLNNKTVEGILTGWADVVLPKWIAAGCPKGVFNGTPDEIDLGILPFPRRQSLMFQEFYKPDDMGIIATSRGCIGRCTFCSNSFMSRYRITRRTDESVRSELEELVDKWQVDRLIATDDTYSDQPKFAKRMARLFKEFGLLWSMEGRWASINRDNFEFFITNGCHHFAVGLESGSDKILRQMRKGATKKLIREKSKILKDLGIKWQLLCIIGFPDETADDMKETMDLALEIEPHLISLNCLCPLPGTEVYKNIPHMTPELASELSQQNPSHCFSTHMDLTEFKGIFTEMLETFDTYNQKRKGSLRD